MHLQDCVWENLYQIIMNTMLQEQKIYHYSITIWCTNLFLCLNHMKIPAAKAAVDKEWENNGENLGVEADKSQK